MVLNTFSVILSTAFLKNGFSGILFGNWLTDLAFAGAGCFFLELEAWGSGFSLLAGPEPEVTFAAAAGGALDLVFLYTGDLVEERSSSLDDLDWDLVIL